MFAPHLDYDTFRVKGQLKAGCGGSRFSFFLATTSWVAVHSGYMNMTGNIGYKNTPSRSDVIKKWCALSVRTEMPQGSGNQFAIRGCRTDLQISNCRQVVHFVQQIWYNKDAKQLDISGSTCTPRHRPSLAAIAAQQEKQQRTRRAESPESASAKILHQVNYYLLNSAYVLKPTHASHQLASLLTTTT